LPHVQRHTIEVAKSVDAGARRDLLYCFLPEPLRSINAFFADILGLRDLIVSFQGHRVFLTIEFSDTSIALSLFLRCDRGKFGRIR
jgi:hypothetical protein